MPIDPVSGALLSAASGEVVRRSLTALTSPWTAPQRQSGEGVDLLSVALSEGDTDEDITGVITHEQAARVGEFLRSREVGSLMQARLLARVGLIKSRDRDNVVAHIADGFDALAAAWCSTNGEDWVSLAPDIWRYLTNYVDSVMPPEKINFLLSADERSRVSTYVTAPALGNSVPLPMFIRQMVSAVKSPERLALVDEALSDLCRGAQSYYNDMSLAHAQEGNRYDFDNLYIDRRLVPSSRTESWDSDVVLNPEKAVPRCVVVGDPGVGKSTLVRHLVNSLAGESSQRPDRIAPLVFRCREFSSSVGSSYLVEVISRAIKDDFQQEVPAAVIEDILAIGRGFLIFDGIDEVIDIGRRQHLVKAISTLAAKFPLAPVLITSRRVGYRRAALDPKEFTVFELDEYSPDQVEKYARKWFQTTGQKEDEVSAFLRESASVGDLRTNPLMLSLLCALYRARGYIPRNRLQIYRSCADLLFVRWDSMRHIEQPFEHKAYGQRLMQELAYFYYKSQSAQGGIEERQLEKITSTFFEDTTAVGKEEARSKAKDFLDFCADRAWLLSAQGTSEYGDRVFGFTHRTFMEYFAAEAIVRRAEAIDDIAREVASAYDRDPSSVLADVIVQCADESRDRGAEQVINNLLSRSSALNRTLEYKYLSLCLRIVNSSVVNKRTMARVFDRLFSYWSCTNPDDCFDTSVALFELYRDPRARFMDILREELDSDDPPDRTLAVLRRWSRVHLLDMSASFDSQVADMMKEFLSRVVQKCFSRVIADWCVCTYALDLGVIRFSNIDVPDGSESELFVLSAFNKLVPGILLRALERSIWSKTDSSTTLEWASNEALAKTQLTSGDARELADVTREIARSHRPVELTQQEQTYVANVTLWVCCVLYETSAPALHPFHDVVDAVVGVECFRRLGMTRSKLMGVAEETSWLDALAKEGYSTLKPYSSKELRALLTGLPRWVPRWVSGRLSFIKIE